MAERDERFIEKVRTIGVMSRRGSTRTTVVRREDDGSPAGKQIEHWDDHVDAVARPRPGRFVLPVGIGGGA